MAKYARRRSYKKKRPSYRKRTYKRRPSFKRRAARPTDGIVSRKICQVYELVAGANPNATPFRVFWGLSATDVSGTPYNIGLASQEEHQQFTTLFTRFRVKGLRVELRVP